MNSVTKKICVFRHIIQNITLYSRIFLCFQKMPSKCLLDESSLIATCVLYVFVSFRQVVMGGGMASFVANSTVIKENPDKNMCTRTDGRNLTSEWIQDKRSRQLSYHYLSNKNDLNSLDAEGTEYVLGG